MSFFFCCFFSFSPPAFSGTVCCNSKFHHLMFCGCLYTQQSYMQCAFLQHMTDTRKIAMKPKFSPKMPVLFIVYQLYFVRLLVPSSHFIAGINRRHKKERGRKTPPFSFFFSCRSNRSRYCCCNCRYLVGKIHRLGMESC